MVDYHIITEATFSDWCRKSVMIHFFISANVLLHPQEGNEVLWWVCLFVCPSVSLPTYLRNHIAELHRIFCACCMWLWLDPPLAVLWSLCTFWFWWHGFILWVLRCIVCILKWWEYSITAETLVSIPTKLGRDQVFIMGCTQRLSLIVCWLVFFLGGEFCDRIWSLPLLIMLTTQWVGLDDCLNTTRKLS